MIDVLQNPIKVSNIEININGFRQRFRGKSSGCDSSQNREYDYRLEEIVVKLNLLKEQWDFVKYLSVRDKEYIPEEVKA